MGSGTTGEADILNKGYKIKYRSKYPLIERNTRKETASGNALAYPVGNFRGGDSSRKDHMGTKLYSGQAGGESPITTRVRKDNRAAENVYRN